MTYITIIRFYLTPIHNIVITSFSGTIVQSLILNWLDKLEPGLADKLHSYKGLKPFSVTPFFIGNKPLIGDQAVIINEGLDLWFRVTLIGDLGLKFLQIIPDLLGNEVKLFSIGAKFIVKDAEVNIIDAEALINTGPKAFKIIFLTPTRFALKATMKRKRVKFSFCPEPARLIKSIYKHWYTFTNKHISSKIIEWTYNYVVLADFGTFRKNKSNVITVKLPKGEIVRGFIGYGIYQVFGSKRLHQLWTLLRYGQLINVGTGKSMGLGVVEVKELKEKEK